MRPLLPIFRRSALTPEPQDRPGLFVAAPGWRGPATAWVHGELVVTKRDAKAGEAAWLRSLFLTAVTEVGGQPQIESLVRGHVFVDAPRFTIDGDLARLPFHVDLGATLPSPLQPEPMWVHVSAREHASDPIRFERTHRVELPADSTPVDALVLAYALLRDGEPVPAVARFAAALGDLALRADLEGAHLYNGACAAALAGEGARALEWLAADVRQRAARLTRLELARAAPALDPARRDALVAARDAQTAHLEALRDDPDLEPVRAHEAFAAIFSPTTWS